MSYDVWMEANLGGPSPYTIDPGINHTSNTSGMWREAGCDLGEMHGSLGEECIPPLEKAIAALTANPNHYRRHEPDNKWGTVETTIDFLSKILAMCKRTPLATLVVSR